MLGYWPYATHKKTNFDIYVYLMQLRRKPGILNTRSIYIFLQHKENSDFKINIPENKYLSLSFKFFFKKKKNSMSGRVTCPSKWPGWTQKQKGAVFSMKQGKMHAKRPRYCSSELKFTWTVQTQSKKNAWCGGWREQTWERKDNGDVWRLAG